MAEFAVSRQWTVRIQGLRCRWWPDASDVSLLLSAVRLVRIGYLGTYRGKYAAAEPEVEILDTRFNLRLTVCRLQAPCTFPAHRNVRQRSMDSLAAPAISSSGIITASPVSLYRAPKITQLYCTVTRFHVNLTF